MDDNDRKDVLAAGGRYDWLIQQFRHPSVVCGRGRQPIYGIGVSIAIQKIVNALGNYQARKIKMVQSKKIEEEKEKNMELWTPRKVYIIYESFILLIFTNNIPWFNIIRIKLQ